MREKETTEPSEFNKIDYWKGFVKRYNIKTETKKETKIQFKCRICGCSEYKGLYGDSIMVPIGRTCYPFAYQCCGCSVIFADYEKFSNYL